MNSKLNICWEDRNRRRFPRVRTIPNFSPSEPGADVSISRMEVETADVYYLQIKLTPVWPYTPRDGIE